MWETILAAAVVFVALLGVGFGLYRTASGKSGCGGCGTCEETSCEASEDTPADTRDS